MAVADRPVATMPAAPMSPVLEALPALLSFVTTLSQRPSVRKLGCSSSGSDVDFWVLTDHEDLGETEALFSVKHEHQKTLPGWLHLDLHVVPLSDVREENLPRFELLYQR